MAWSLRIDDVVRDTNTGQVTFQYTSGTAPLPVGWHGTGLSFGNTQQTIEALQDADGSSQDALVQMMLVFVLRVLRKLNPDVTAAQFRNACRGLTVTVDVNAATRAAAITLA